MTRHGSRRGAGTAWLVADRLRGDYACYWYQGRQDDHLVERGRAADAPGAVAWGRLRTGQVRIRTAAGRSLWAGSAPRPDGFGHDWTGEEPAATVPVGRATTGVPPC